MSKIFNYFATIVLLITFTSVTFVAGVYLGQKQGLYQVLSNQWKGIKSEFFGKPHHVYPARYDEEGVTVNREDKTYSGATLITGYWKGDGNDYYIGARLLAMNGDLLHEWKVDFEDLEIDPSLKERTYIHGTHLYPNGDILLNLEYVGLFKLDKSSDLIWKITNGAHHSIFLDEDDNIWVGGIKGYTETTPDFPRLKPPFYDNLIVKVTPDGKVEKEISILESMVNSGYNGILRSDTGDLLHLNKVEVLSESKAKHFDSFNPGDILISLRNINTILVIDKDTQEVKWSLTHPFIGQHDPDFTNDGQILVFDNHSNWVDKAAEAIGSRLVKIDPDTNKISTIYGQKEGEYFYTAGGGKNQILPNNNIVITEARSGRVFEITPEGEVVWSWISPRWDDSSVSEILEGTRYNFNALDFISPDQRPQKN